MKDQMLTKIIRKSVLRAEAQACQREWQRLQNQIEALELAQRNVISDMRKKEDEAQEIAEWIDNETYESMKEYEESLTTKQQP